jgi:chromosome partitioning protein
METRNQSWFEGGVMTYRIGIANEKGGVAKTTTAVSLGAVLVNLGYKVLLVDLDPQSNLSLALGMEPNRVQRSSASILIEQFPIVNAIKETSIPGLFIVPANNELGMAERFLPGRQGYENFLKRALDQLQPDFDFVIMDCPPFLGSVTLNVMVSLNLLIIPTQAEFFSIYALRNLMALVRRVRAQFNPKLKYRLLLTMVDRRNKIHRVMSEQLRSTFNQGVMETVIETDTKLRESPVAGVPIIHHSPKSRGSLQYRALAQEILEYVKENTVQPA